MLSSNFAGWFIEFTWLKNKLGWNKSRIQRAPHWPTREVQLANSTHTHKVGWQRDIPRACHPHQRIGRQVWPQLPKGSGILLQIQICSPSRVQEIHRHWMQGLPEDRGGKASCLQRADSIIGYYWQWTWGHAREKCSIHGCIYVGWSAQVHWTGHEHDKSPPWQNGIQGWQEHRENW